MIRQKDLIYFLVFFEHKFIRGTNLTEAHYYTTNTHHRVIGFYIYLHIPFLKDQNNKSPLSPTKKYEHHFPFN